MDVNCRQVHLPVNQTTHTVTLNFTNNDIPPGYVWLWAVSADGNYSNALTSHLTD
jgi:hypothetical protein